MSKKAMSSAKLNNEYGNVSDIFRHKQAYEKPNERVHNKVISIIFNVLSVVIFATLALSYNAEMTEKMLVCVAWFVIAICVELGKRKYGSNYKSKDLAHEDDDLTDEHQQEFYHESKKSLNIFSGFLIFSVVIATLSGSRNSYLFAVSSVQEQTFVKETHIKEGYDAALQNAVVMAQKNHDAAIKSDKHDISSHRKALRNYNEVVENYEAHKKEVDGRNAKAKAEAEGRNDAGQKKTEDYNKSLKKDGHNDGVIYAICGFVLSLIVEFFSVFYLFQYITASYETYKSIKNKAQIVHETTESKGIVINDQLQNADFKIIKNQAAPTLSIDDEETMLLARLAALQQKKP